MKLKKSDLNKICIYGGSGSGKSTLSLQLGKKLAIQTTHIDDLFWLPNWKMKNPKNLLHDIEYIVNKECWIIDGNYSYVSKLVMSKANIILIIHLPLWLVIWRITIRSIGRRYKLRFLQITPLPKNVKKSNEPKDIVRTISILTKQTVKFYFFKYKFYYTQALSIKPKKPVVVFKSTKEIEKFLQLIDKVKFGGIIQTSTL